MVSHINPLTQSSQPNERVVVDCLFVPKSSFQPCLLGSSKLMLVFVKGTEPISSRKVQGRLY